MFKKFLVLTLAIATIFSLVACGEDTTNTPATTPTEAPVATATPVPLAKMTDDLIGESKLTYKKLLKDVKPVYEEKLKDSDISEPFDVDNGITASIFYVLKEDALFDCNVLGYKYTDSTNSSYLKAIYEEYEGKPYNVKLEGIYLDYKFICESKEYAFKLMERDVKALCAFAEVEEAKTSSEVSQATCDSMLTTNSALTVTANKNVSAAITVSKVDGSIVYHISVVIK